MSENGLHQLHKNVRDEASSDMDTVHTGPVTKETQIIALDVCSGRRLDRGIGRCHSYW
ncbi:hypothetical protein [Gemmatimonas sp.]